MTAVLVLNCTRSCSVSLIASKAWTWASIQSGSVCVQVARANVWLLRAQHGDENLRLTDFPSEPIDDDRHAVAGVINEQSLASGMRLSHRRRQFRVKGAVEFAEPRIAVTARIFSDIFVPDDQQGDVLAFQASDELSANPAQL